MKNLLMITILALITLSLNQASFAETRSKFMGGTYIIPETTSQDVSVKDNAVRKSDPVRGKFLGAIYTIPEPTYQNVSVENNAVRKSEPVRSKFMGATIKD